MIEVGQARAKQASQENIHWVIRRAEEFKAPSSSLELITIGEAFHRLDQSRIANRALDWLAPGCCLATLGCFSLQQGLEPWHDVLRAVTRPWLKRRITTPPESTRTSSRSRGSNHERKVLTAFGFDHVATCDFVHPYVWNLHSILGNLHSTSNLSKRVLGNEAKHFASKVRSALLAYDSSGRYPENLRYGYSLFRKPRC